MLWTALEDPDPVLIFEHGALYNVEGDLAADAGAVDIERAAVRRPGPTCRSSRTAACCHGARCRGRGARTIGLDAEVIDLRVLRPLDTDASSTSVRRRTALSWSTKAGAAAASRPR